MTFTNYLLKYNAWQIIIALVIFLGLAIVSVYNPDLHKSIAWAEAIAGFGTLFFAAFIWINEVKKRWEHALPKKLDAHFQFDGRDLIACYNVLLFNESDARAWAQQIGRQMAKDNLDFEPFFQFKDKGIVETKNQEKIKQFEMTFYLTKVPEKLKERLGYAGESALGKQCLEWYQIQNPDGSYIIEENVVPSKQKMMAN